MASGVVPKHLCTARVPMHDQFQKNAVQLSQTDEKLNTLIHVHDDWIRTHGNGHF